MTPVSRSLSAIACVLSFALAACGPAPGPEPAETAANEPLRATDDLDGIVTRGKLRVLVEREPEIYLPRHGAGLYEERELAQRFAERFGIDAELVFIDRFSELLPALLDGRGDVAAANLTATAERMASVRFTRPLRYSRIRPGRFERRSAWPRSGGSRGKRLPRRWWQAGVGERFPGC